MTKQKLSALILILALAAGNVYLFLFLRKTQEDLQSARVDVIETVNAKKPIIEFNRLFVDKVLRAEGEISFETRLELENKVRDLKDEEILDRWNGFVNAQTQTEAQTEVKALLGLLTQRMEN